MRAIGLIGVPTSAGAFAPGQEQAPAALRAAGLVEALTVDGTAFEDHGDREVWRWHPDREARRATSPAAGSGSSTSTPTPISTSPTRFQRGRSTGWGWRTCWGVDGARRELAGVGPRLPLLEPEQVVLFGWGPQQATAVELEQIERPGIDTVPVEEVAADPEAAAARALALLEPRCDLLLVHFDVDVVDFTDTPLSENWRRNEGLPFATALRALAPLLASPQLAGLTITELNPDHTEDGSDAIDRLVTAVAAGLTT